jgi:osmotically-inducible protein OsmY
MSNEELELNVNDELLWDPKVDNAAIAVSADDGVVTLRGTDLLDRAAAGTAGLQPGPY